jgi:hypothetical protein
MRYLLILALSATCFAQQPQRVVDRPFILLNGAQYMMGLADTMVTQDCIRADTCHEANPWMPSSAWGQFGVITGVSAAEVLASYELKKSGSKWWVLVPAVGIAGHAVGIGSGVRYFEWRFALP